MCLGVPGKITKLDKLLMTAVVEFSGVKRPVGTELVREAAPGDYVLVHAGQAIEKLDPAEAEARIKLWEEILKIEGAAEIPGPGPG